MLFFFFSLQQFDGEHGDVRNLVFTFCFVVLFNYFLRLRFGVCLTCCLSGLKFLLYLGKIRCRLSWDQAMGFLVLRIKVWIQLGVFVQSDDWSDVSVFLPSTFTQNFLLLSFILQGIYHVENFPSNRFVGSENHLLSFRNHPKQA